MRGLKGQLQLPFDATIERENKMIVPAPRSPRTGKRERGNGEKVSTTVPRETGKFPRSPFPLSRGNGGTGYAGTGKPSPVFPLSLSDRGFPGFSRGTVGATTGD